VTVMEEDTVAPEVEALPTGLLRAAPSGDLWRAMFDASPFACSVVDIASGQLIVNRAYRGLLGVADDEEVTIADVRRRTHPDEIDELNSRFGALDRGEVDSVELDRRYVRDDGSVFWGHLVTTLVRDEQGEPVVVIGSVEDISERVRQLGTIRTQARMLDEQNHRLSQQAGELVEARDQAVRSSRRHAALFEAGFEHSPIGIALIDPGGLVQRANPALGRMLDYRPDELVGRPLGRLVEPVTPALGDLRARRSGTWATESSCRRRDGVTLWIDVHITALADGAGEPTGYFAQIQDITDRRRSELALDHQATHDSLTGLANRHHFLTRSEGIVDRVRSPDDDVALLFIDVDRFKIINDSLGHTVGDRLLRELAERFTRALPAAEIARLGGDEFGVLAVVPHGSHDAAQALADRLHTACAAPFEIGGHEMIVSVSIGIVHTDERSLDTEDLLRRADAAMYRAKAAGRSTSRFLDDHTLATLRERFELSTELGHALERDELFLSYQPEFDLRTGELVAAEALLRWRHPRLGVLPAARFVGMSEETGQIIDIGSWVQREAVAQAARWPVGPGGRRILTRINLAAHQLGRDQLAAQVGALFERSGVAPADICFEITESALLEFGEAARRNLRALAELGVGLAIDDFGTGYSSLTYLKEIPARTLKIDMSFVHGLERDERDNAIVATILDLAERLGFEAVAEGVETAKQATILEALGCRRAQGLLLAPPEAADDVARRILDGTGAPRR
jgi:diguanylate cyclase (GGDEF)-like protein/PAS domain S-box-containing protein